MLFYLGLIIISCGIFVILSGIIGLYRFNDFYLKLHAASVVECCGIPISLFGLSLLQDSFTSAAKILLIIVLILLLNPVSTHALAKASLQE